MCDLCSITLNKNAVFGDSSALAPGGVRIGECIPLHRKYYHANVVTSYSPDLADCYGIDSWLQNTTLQNHELI
jgi:hypothetical protein